jgi:pimeloyl-ACP methyl ester carboxylesterase
MKIDKFVLMGHSLGAVICTAYANKVRAACVSSLVVTAACGSCCASVWRAVHRANRAASARVAGARTTLADPADQAATHLPHRICRLVRWGEVSHLHCGAVDAPCTAAHRFDRVWCGVCVRACVCDLRTTCAVCAAVDPASISCS